MAEFGIALMGENLRRRYPHADDAEIARRLAAWLAGPPMEAVDLKLVGWR